MFRCDLNNLLSKFVSCNDLCFGPFFQTKCKALPPGSAVSMLRSLFQDVHVQVRLCMVSK